MKCEYCGKILSDDALFCTACGGKLGPRSKMMQPRYCSVCGNIISEGSAFCTVCGTGVDNANTRNANAGKAYPDTASNNQLSGGKNTAGTNYSNNGHSAAGFEPAENSYKASRKKAVSSTGKKTMIIAIVSIFFLLICAVGFMFFYNNVLNPDNDEIVEDYDETSDDDTDDASNDTLNEISDDKDKSDLDGKEETGKADGETSEAEKADDGKSDKAEDEKVEADYDLSEHPEVSLEGTFSESNSGDYIIKLPQNLSFADGDVVLEEVKSVRLDMSDLDYRVSDYVEKGDNIKVSGQGYTADGKVYIKINSVLDSEGVDVTEKEKDASDGLSENSDSDYIISKSSSELLTEADIKGLSLRELNYAKNEIYARHGRKFQSKELQDYFNSKDWYKGTIEPEDFSDNLLNDVELANAKLLRDKEYSVDSNGYQLDQ